MDSPTGIRSETIDRVILITFDRATTENAFNRSMFAAFHEVLDAAEHDDSVAAIVLTGAKVVFSAGIDPEVFEDLRPQYAMDSIYRLMVRLATLTKPLIAAANGPSAGFGATLQLHCDLVFASPQATFRFSFLEHGIAPDAGSSILLETFLGRRMAFELMLTGREIPPIEAKEIGLVTRIVPSHDLLATALQAAQAIALYPPTAVRETLILMRSASREAAMWGIEREMDALNRLVPGFLVRRRERLDVSS